MADKNNKELVMEFQRIRNVKPQFFSHEGLYDAEVRAGVPVRLGFIGLWTCCDKHGRFEWKPRQLKLKALPYDEIDFNKVLDALVETDSIRKYEVDGKQYGYIPSWRKHQYISPKELKVKSQCPAPPGVVDGPETDLEDVPEMAETEDEPGRVGTETVPEPGRAVRVGVGNANGNGKECVAIGVANVGSKAAQSQSHSPTHSMNEHSFLSNSNQQPQSKPTIEPALTSEEAARLMGEIGPEDLDLDPAEFLAEVFHDLLPQEARDAAPRAWEKLWAKDLQVLLDRGLNSRNIRPVMEYAMRSRWSKYCVRALKFVELFDEIREEMKKLEKKGKLPLPKKPPLSPWMNSNSRRSAFRRMRS